MCGTNKSRQNSRGTKIAKFASAAPLMTVLLTETTGVAPVNVLEPEKKLFWY